MIPVKAFLFIGLFYFVAAKNVQTQQTITATQPLDKKQHSLVLIAALAGKGDTKNLHTAFNEGLDAGWTINELKEAAVHVYAYAGFPRSLNTLSTLQSVVKERKEKGIKDELGREPSPLPANKTKLELGTELQAKLLGRTMKTSTADFAPIIDVFLKEHLFGDIFGRDNLDFKTREFITISTLAGLGGAENQLRSHINVGMYNGITTAQLHSMVDILKTKVGPAESNAMKEILKTIATNTEPVAKPQQNPFTLVYGGAITENVKGQVNIHPVTYSIKGIAIVANVYTPHNYDPQKKYPAIVIAHPNGGVKEQVAGLYAQRLAEQGYITITADAAYQGGSGGTPRYVDKPANRIEDIHAMADFISQYKGVDIARLGLLGICGGGGYSLKAAQADKRFKAIATVSMFNSGVVRRNGFMNSQFSTIQQRLKQGSDARALEAAGGEVLYANNSTTPLTDEQIAKLPFDLYREGYIYYGKTHAHPNASGKYTLSSLMDLMTFDASTNMDLINQPLLMIAGSKADTYYMTDDAFGKATNARNKELFLINGATHIQTYWKPEYVSQAVNKLVNFYQTNL